MGSKWARLEKIEACLEYVKEPRFDRFRDQRQRIESGQIGDLEKLMIEGWEERLKPELLGLWEHTEQTAQRWGFAHLSPEERDRLKKTYLMAKRLHGVAVGRDYPSSWWEEARAAVEKEENTLNETNRQQASDENEE